MYLAWYGGTSFGIEDNNNNVHEIAGVVGYNTDWDLAIIRTNAVTSLPSLSLGSLSTVQKGDQVVAIGSPLGLLNTVTSGVVSNVHNVEGNNIFQISAPLAPGSSGGVLLNMKGQVIGVTWMGIEGTDLNFVIPVDYLLPLYEPVKSMH